MLFKKFLKQISQNYQANQCSWLGLSVGLSHPKVRDKVKPPFWAKNHDLIKICGKFLVFPSVIKKTKFSLPKGYQYKNMEV